MNPENLFLVQNNISKYVYIFIFLLVPVLNSSLRALFNWDLNCYFGKPLLNVNLVGRLLPALALSLSSRTRL